jgi:hypothetical protein
LLSDSRLQLTPLRLLPVGQRRFRVVVATVKIGGDGCRYDDRIVSLPPLLSALGTKTKGHDMERSERLLFFFSLEHLLLTNASRKGLSGSQAVVTPPAAGLISSVGRQKDD